MKDIVFLSTPHMGGEEMKYINLAFDQNQIFPLGPNVTGLEEELKRYTGAPHCKCLSSGTAAIHLALNILGVGRGDEVLCSTLTFCASANPIVYQGAKPVFVDSEPSTWNMDPDLLEEAILARIRLGKKPKAIIVVHLYGMPARMPDILSLANRFDIPVIEDAAEALGSSLHGKKCGTFGDISIISFNGNKIITTSGGGALLSNTKAYAEMALFLATQARDDAPHYQHSEIGYNYRMSNICAGIGRGQMEVLPQRVSQRRANFFFYREALKEVDGITFLEEPDNSFYSNHWLTTILIDPRKTGGITPLQVQNSLSEQNIESRPVWKPMHMQPVFKSSPVYRNGVSEEVFTQGLCLPSSSSLKQETLEFVVETLIHALKRNGYAHRQDLMPQHEIPSLVTR